MALGKGLQNFAKLTRSNPLLLLRDLRQIINLFRTILVTTLGTTCKHFKIIKRYWQKQNKTGKGYNKKYPV